MLPMVAYVYTGWTSGRGRLVLSTFFDPAPEEIFRVNL